jgi:hypothetical protein
VPVLQFTSNMVEWQGIYGTQWSVTVSGGADAPFWPDVSPSQEWTEDTQGQKYCMYNLSSRNLRLSLLGLTKSGSRMYYRMYYLSWKFLNWDLICFFFSSSVLQVSRVTGNTNFPDLTGCVEIMKFQNDADTWEEGLILMSTRNLDNEDE